MECMAMHFTGNTITIIFDLMNKMYISKVFLNKKSISKSYFIIDHFYYQNFCISYITNVLNSIICMNIFYDCVNCGVQ